MDSAKYLAKLRRKQLIEERRRPRILDEKKRTIGIDANELERQIKEKELLCEKLHKEDTAIEKLMQESDHRLVEKYRQEMARRRQRCIEIDKFRAEYQNPEQSSTWDINDPQAVLKSAPIRRASQKVFPPSSLLRLDGERQKDPDYEYFSNQDFNFKPVASWKGFTQKQWDEYRKEQERQIRLKESREDAERQRELAIDRRIIDKSEQEYQKDLAQKAELRKHLREIERLNQELSEIHVERQRRLKKEIYDANVISEEFFKQFGTTSR